VSTMTKVFIVLTTVLSITASALFIGAAAQWANWKEVAQTYQQLQHAELVKRMNLEATTAAALAMKDAGLADSSARLARSQEDNTRMANELATVRNDLARRTNEAVAAEAGRKKQEEILAVQTAELTGLQKQTQTLLTQNIDLQTRNQRLNSRVLELTSQVTIATDQIRNLQEKLYAMEQQVAGVAPRAYRQAAAELEIPRVAPVTPTVAGPIRGEITSVNSGYASISVGETSGVVSGMVFLIYRGSQYVGEFVVDSVRPTESGGKLQTLAGQVSAGDRVMFGFDAATR
jgi:hypothetical protein